jgi:hypothetical protein
MSYEENILNRLKDSSGWPGIERSDFLGRLDEIADDAFTIPDERSCISSVLIYQQLTEELLKTLLRACNFLIQAKLLPFEISLSEPQGKMFGQVIQEFKKSIDIPNKGEIVERANTINKHRIEVAHGLTKKESLDDLLQMALTVRDEFELFFKLYSESYDWIRLCLKDLKKDIVEDY